MLYLKRSTIATFLFVGLLSSMSLASQPKLPHDKGSSILGAWRTTVQFVDGPYAAVKDLKFLIAFNQGGTLIESSNYDEAPPVTPAYGIWKKTGRGTFKLLYEFFNTKAPEKMDEISGGGGWMPSGWGILTETVKLTGDGKSYTSKLTFTLKDDKGKVIPGGGKAICHGERITF